MRNLIRSAMALACLALSSAPALALEEVVVELPLMENSLTVKLSELKNPEALMQGSSDLAELDRASDGELGRKLLKLLNHPVPVSFRQMAESSVGSPLLAQALLLVSSFGTVEGRSPDLSGATLKQALDKATAESVDGHPTLLQLMEAIPGERVRLTATVEIAAVGIAAGTGTAAAISWSARWRWRSMRANTTWACDRLSRTRSPGIASIN